MGLCNFLPYTSRIGYENTYDNHGKNTYGMRVVWIILHFQI